MNKYIKIKVGNILGGSGNPKLNLGNPKLNLGNLVSSTAAKVSNINLSDDDIYIELWNSIDKTKFDRNNDNFVTKGEYNNTINSYFDFATIKYPSEFLDNERYQNE